MKNISKEKREKLISFLEKLKKEHKDSEYLRQFNEIEKMINEKKYGLIWEEYSEAVDEQLEDNIPIFEEKVEKEILQDENDKYNFLIEGDNLHSLKMLNKTHRGKIDVIYIDPPYNTKKKEFIYNDTRLGPDSEYRHSKWISFMRERLIKASSLLKNTGVIFISIDDNEQAQLKLLCDEIFGENNFIAMICRNTNSAKNQSLYISVSHEYCLVYSKNAEVLALKHADNKWEVEKNNVNEYIKTVNTLKKKGLSKDEITKELKELTKYPRFIDMTNYWYFDDRGLYQKDNLGGVKNGNNTPIINPLTGKEDPIPPGGFRYNEEKINQLIKEDRIHFHTDGSLPRLKRYLLENIKQRPKSIMSDDQRPDNKLLKRLGIKFDNPKQMTFMKRILSIFDKDALFLDFFAGSGTTGHAIVELNKEDGGLRKYILCTDNENNICEDATYKRLCNIQNELPHNLKYLKTELVPKLIDENTNILQLLNKYIKALIELENMKSIDNKNILFIEDENTVKDMLLNANKEAKVYIDSEIFLSSEEENIANEKDITIIQVPEYFYSEELEEVGEM